VVLHGRSAAGTGQWRRLARRHRVGLGARARRAQREADRPDRSALGAAGCHLRVVSLARAPDGRRCRRTRCAPITAGDIIRRVDPTTAGASVRLRPPSGTAAQPTGSSWWSRSCAAGFIRTSHYGIGSHRRDRVRLRPHRRRAPAAAGRPAVEGCVTRPGGGRRRLLDASRARTARRDGQLAADINAMCDRIADADCKGPRLPLPVVRSSSCAHSDRFAVWGSWHERGAQARHAAERSSPRAPSCETDAGLSAEAAGNARTSWSSGDG